MDNMPKFCKSIARLEILNYMFKFCLSRRYNGESKNVGGHDNDYFVPYFSCGMLPQKGDLVALSSVSTTTEWYLSWYLDFMPGCDCFSNVHVLESIDNGNLCNWSNVSFYVMNRDIVDKNPQWKWTDKQFEFKKRWFKTCNKNTDYITSPCLPVFGDRFKVVLSTRKKYGFGDGAQHVFNDWRKVTIKDMVNFYDSSKLKK